MKMYLLTAISAAVIGAWAALFAGALTRPGEILAFIPRLYRWIVRAPEGEYLQGWRYTLSKPLYECAICHAGQVSLWGYLLLYPYGWVFFDHFAFVVVAMLTATAINKWLWS